MKTEQCRNVVIGSGEGGKYLAWHLARGGEPTMVIERKYVGGSCPNINCLPAKNEIWSAKVAHLARHAAEFGVLTDRVSVDMEMVLQRKRAMVDGLVELHRKKYEATGARLVMGSASFLGPGTLRVELEDHGGEVRVEAERIFLDLGTHAATPDVPGLAESDPLTHIELLELSYLPEHLVVVGGGYVGLEFAQALRRFGSKVTILQRGPHLLSDQDQDVSDEIQRILVSEGIDVLTSVEINSVRGRSGSEVTLAIGTPAGDREVRASDLLVATGRIPNTHGIGLDLVGVELDDRGYIRVNDRLETTAPNVWAIGESAGSPQFTHASMDDYRVIRENLAGNSRSTEGRLMPSCLFTDPQVAHVGLTEIEAKRKGIAYELVRLPMAAVLRTRTISETQGFMKSLISPEDGRILGFSMVGAEAGEVMAVVQMAMQAGMACTALRDAVLAHPTMAEGLNSLYADVKTKVAGIGRSPGSSGWPRASVHRIEADGVKVFYREAGPGDAPVVLLLHGFPTSSFQYRELLPRLADRYRVIAPDLPGFGFTEVPEDRNYSYTFDSLARTMDGFIDAMGLERYALYIFDYGAPTGLRVAMRRPEKVTAIISQNGNAYEEGLGDAWAPLRRYWSAPTLENREAIRSVLNAEGMRREYGSGMADPGVLAPEGYTLDAALLARAGNQDIQLDLFLDYASNVKLYPEFQKYFRKWTPPFLAIWGRHDPYFIPAGAEAFRRDIPKAEVTFLDTGHFALETHVNEIAERMREFLGRVVK